MYFTIVLLHAHIDLVPKMDQHTMEKFKYFINMENFDATNKDQLLELSRIQKHIDLVPLENWFKEQFLYKMAITRRSNRHVDVIFLTIDNVIYFQINGLNSLWCKLTNFWNLFSHYFPMSRLEIKEFMKKEVVNKLKTSHLLHFILIVAILEY